MIYFKRRQQGLSNLEVMLMLVIAAGIVILVLRQYQHHLFQKNVITIDSSVKIILTATQKYYYENCKTLKHDNKTLDLKTDLAKHMSNIKVIQDPFDPKNSLAHYGAELIWKEIAATPTEKPRWMMKVKYTLPASVDALLAQTYASMLHSTSQDGNTLYWEQNITVSGKSSSANLSPQISDIDRYSHNLTIKPGYEKFKPSDANDPCSLV